MGSDGSAVKVYAGGLGYFELGTLETVVFVRVNVGMLGTSVGVGSDGENGEKVE